MLLRLISFLENKIFAQKGLRTHDQKTKRKCSSGFFASAVLLIAAVLIPYEGALRFLLFLPAYFVIGWDVLWRAAKNIIHGQVFDEIFLMALATVEPSVPAFSARGDILSRIRHAVLPGGGAVSELCSGETRKPSLL